MYYCQLAFDLMVLLALLLEVVGSVYAIEKNENERMTPKIGCRLKIERAWIRSNFAGVRIDLSLSAPNCPLFASRSPKLSSCFPIFASDKKTTTTNTPTEN